MYLTSFRYGLESRSLRCACGLQRGQNAAASVSSGMAIVMARESAHSQINDSTSGQSGRAGMRTARLISQSVQAVGLVACAPRRDRLTRDAVAFG
jgi:hypothetical protein